MIRGVQREEKRMVFHLEHYCSKELFYCIVELELLSPKDRIPNSENSNTTLSFQKSRPELTLL